MSLVTHAEKWNRLFQKREQIPEALLKRIHRFQVFRRATHFFGDVRRIGRMVVSPPKRLIADRFDDQALEHINVFALRAEEPRFDSPCSFATDLGHVAETSKSFQTLCGLFKT